MQFVEKLHYLKLFFIVETFAFPKITGFVKVKTSLKSVEVAR